MNRHSRISLLFITLFLLSATPLFATDMSQGLQCPPGWNDNYSARGNDLIKQCISPTQDAAIELYAAPGQEVPLGSLLDMWAQEMTQRGLPFQNKVSEVPGQVSGYPAVTRTYSGHTRDGNQFDSHLVASRYNGVNYVFQGFALKGRSQAWHQLRHAMNSWFYPGAGQQNYNQQQSGLPLSVGSTGNTPYGNDPYGNTQAHSMPPSNIKVDRHGNGCGAMYKVYADGHHIMDFQCSYIGNRPFMDADKLGFDWTKKKYRNFFKITAQNYSDSEIRATMLVSNSYKALTKYCTIRSFCQPVPENSRNLHRRQIKDYWGGSYHYRMYLFNSDGTFTSGNKSATTGKVKMHSQKQRL